MPVLLTLIVGAAAGFIVVHLMGLRVGALTAIGIGVLGAVLGGVALRALFALFAGASSLLSLFLGAILGAFVLIWIYTTFFQK